MSKKNIVYLIKKIKLICVLLFILLNISSILYNYNINFNIGINSRKNFNILSDDLPIITPIIIENLTDLNGSEILEGLPVVIKVNLSGIIAIGVQEVYLNYMVNGIPQIPIPMTMEEYINESLSYHYNGTIPAQAEGAMVNYCITILDYCGHLTTSSYSSYIVVDRDTEINIEFHWMLILFIIVIGAVTVASLTSYSVSIKNRNKQKRNFKAEKNQNADMS